jgi:hypothetical protein
MVGCADPHTRAAECSGQGRSLARLREQWQTPCEMPHFSTSNHRVELSRTCHRPSAEPLLSRWNESRTNRARIADSGPVGIRSRQYVVALAVLTTKSCKRPVNGCKWLQKNDRQSITGSACSPKFAVSELGRRLSHHCDFTVALLGCGVDMNCVACRTPSPIGVGTVTRKGTITRVPAMGASQSSISRSCMRYLIA